MSDPLVSVIIIFHNEERFLPDAVASVEAQSEDDWELLLVDDGSTDAGSAWARAKAEANPDRIRYLTHPDRANKGMSATRNVGIGAATGTWISFLDADDVWQPEKLRSQLALLRAHPAVDVLVSPAQWWRSWDEGEGRTDDDWVQSLGTTTTTVVDPPYLVARYLDDEWSSVTDLMISRDVVNEVGGYEDAFAGMFEDQVFHAKVFVDRPALVTEDWWYRYRQHADTSTARAHSSGGHDAARKAFLEWLDGYLAANHPANRRLRSQVRRHRIPYRFRTLSRIWRRLRKIAGRPV